MKVLLLLVLLFLGSVQGLCPRRISHNGNKLKQLLGDNGVPLPPLGSCGDNSSGSSWWCLWRGMLAQVIPPTIHDCDAKGIMSQHIAVETVATAVSGFLARPQARKPLSMLFCGPPGSGKSYMEQTLRHQLFSHDSLITTENAFYLVNGASYNLTSVREEEIAVREIINAIAKQIRQCPNSVITIDDLHMMRKSMSNTLVRNLLPLMSSQQPFEWNSQFVDGRKVMFIFTTHLNYGGIVARTKALLSSRPRSQLKYIDYEDVIRQNFMEGDSFYILFKNGIDYYIPFLPMTTAEGRLFVERQLQAMRCRFIRDNLYVNVTWTPDVADYVTTLVERDKDGFLKYGLNRIEDPHFMTEVVSTVKLHAEQERDEREGTAPRKSVHLYLVDQGPYEKEVVFEEKIVVVEKDEGTKYGDEDEDDEF